MPLWPGALGRIDRHCSQFTFVWDRLLRLYMKHFYDMPVFSKAGIAFATSACFSGLRSGSTLPDHTLGPVAVFQDLPPRFRGPVARSDIRRRPLSMGRMSPLPGAILPGIVRSLCRWQQCQIYDHQCKRWHGQSNYQTADIRRELLQTLSPNRPASGDLDYSWMQSAWDPHRSAPWLRLA